MLSPECKQGDGESDLLITALINGDGYKAADAEGRGPRSSGWRGGDFCFHWLLRKGQHEWVGESEKIFLWVSPSCLLSLHPDAVSL